MSCYVLEPRNPNRSNILENLKRFLESLDPAKAWEITIERFVKERTIPQCRYLNGVAYKLLGDSLGFERDDISEYLCGEFFGWRTRALPGDRTEDVPLRTTTTDTDGKRAVLSTIEFAEYVEFVQRFGAKHGVFIPDPAPDLVMPEHVRAA